MFSVNQKVRGTRSAYVGNVRLTGELWKRPYLPLLSPSTALNLPAWPKPPAGRSQGGGLTGAPMLFLELLPRALQSVSCLCALPESLSAFHHVLGWWESGKMGVTPHHHPTPPPLLPPPPPFSSHLF